MLLRIGNCEKEIKVAAVMSTPRLGFTDNFFCVGSALARHGISPTKVTGAFWGISLQMAMEEVVDTHDVILTIDYDTVFSGKTVEGLLALLLHSGYDAIAPLQCKREMDALMLALPEHDLGTKNEVSAEWFKQPVQPVKTAHFGLTFIRTEALKKTPKPWFLAQPNAEGRWGEGRIDEDLYFWHEFAKAGNKLGMATQISVGHAELMISWPSLDGGKVLQHTTDYWSNGQKAPERAWGHVS